MSRKLSRRDRYVLKWNGPDALKHRKRVRAQCRREMGRGTHLQRFIATAYVCRFRGFFPTSDRELCRMAGIPETGAMF